MIRMASQIIKIANKNEIKQFLNELIGLFKLVNIFFFINIIN